MCKCVVPDAMTVAARHTTLADVVSVTSRERVARVFDGRSASQTERWNGRFQICSLDDTFSNDAFRFFSPHYYL